MPIALARDAWLESDEGKRCLDGDAAGRFLRNRLEAAFVSGFIDGERAALVKAAGLVRDLATSDELIDFSPGVTPAGVAEAILAAIEAKP